MKGIVQKKQSGCDGCAFCYDSESDDFACMMRPEDASAWHDNDDFFDCQKHNCIYVIADVEPKESE